MASDLKNLYSVINDKSDAKDSKRVFTFIEFIKEFGYDNSPSSFLNEYKSYLSLWNKKQSESTTISDKEWIQKSLVDTLKSIVLTYSSYEEQDFIANIDWNNEMHRRAIIPFFAEKIKNLCDFYRTKRQESSLIINKNKFKGSRTSLEQIIYDKIIDFYFENRDLVVQVSEIKEKLQQNLSISIEQYIDIYSDYFDIPRAPVLNDDSRAAFITANINTPNYEDYLEVAKVVSDTLFSGELYLEEIPLIAQVGLDLSQKCAGDVSTLRDTLLENATINLISINEQIALRRKLYEKYLGCDLYYIYCNTQDDIQFDILTKATNPSGNLLNCGTSDTAVVESDDLKLLSQIGLFFKPDKMGILKINADNFKWEIDKSKLTDETFYIFPDPNKYGDIGNNKSTDYPLIFEYKLDSYIKNLSSGYAKDEPLAYISTTTWNTYYSIQDRDYILHNNQDFEYSFTSLANEGILLNYQKDLYGNEFGLLKGYTEKIIDGKKVLCVPSKFKLPKIEYKPGGAPSYYNTPGDRNVLLNGGYYIDPRTIKKTKFPENENLRLADDYIWTGLSISGGKFTRPDIATDATLELGSFSGKSAVKYVDHYKVVQSFVNTLSKNTTFVSTPLVKDYMSKVSELTGYTDIIEEDKTVHDISQEPGTLYIKEPGKAPFTFMPSYKENNVSIETFNGKIINFSVFENILIIEVANKIYFFEEEIGTPAFYEIESIDIQDNESYSIFYNESKEQLIIAVLRQKPNGNLYSGIDLIIHEFDIPTKKLRRNTIFASNLDNFKYVRDHHKIKRVIFTYNNDLDIYFLAYLLKNGLTPYIYEHQFRLYNKERFDATLQSSVIYNGGIETATPLYIYNSTLYDTTNPFFIKQ